MKRIGIRSSVGLVSSALCALLMGCAKKEPKPMRTEPWLAQPSARASASGAAALPTTRYALGPDSVIRFEIPTKQGPLSGSLTRVSGEFDVDLSNLSQSRGSVRAELASLEIHTKSGAAGNDSALLERARVALELSSDASAPPAFASFELTSVEDASPTFIDPLRDPRPREAGHERDASTSSSFSRHARLTAVGDLLLHGFRVVRRVPLTAEFGFTADGGTPQTLVIRSRAPFVVSLETHAIVALLPESRTKVPGSAPAAAREAHVTLEFYGTKSD